MAGPSSKPQLALATSRAGALGFIAAGHFNFKDLTNTIEEFRILAKPKKDSRAADEYPLCIGFIGFSSFSTPQKWKDFEEILQTYQPDVVQFFAPSISFHPHDSRISNVKLAQSYGSLVISQVGNVQEGLEAYEQGVDCIIAQGSEAGGHGLRHPLGRAAHVLASELLQKTNDIPILLAGGVVHGRHLASALALGCDGAVLGTRLWASEESAGNFQAKAHIVNTESCDQTVRTTVYDQIQNKTLSIPWPQPYDSVGVIRNKTSSDWDENESKLEVELCSTQSSDWLKAYRESDFNPDIHFVLAGQASGQINAIESVDKIIIDIMSSCESSIERLSRIII